MFCICIAIRSFRTVVWTQLLNLDGKAHMIVIVDYGMGNLGSIVNMLKRIGVKALVSGNPQEIDQATKLILPGVGAFDTAMARLAEMDLIQLLNQKVVEQQTLTLGVCLGMQLLTERSEEGELPGLGWIQGETVRFRFQEENNRLKIPHMGWNSTVVQHDDILATTGARFPFLFCTSVSRCM